MHRNLRLFYILLFLTAVAIIVREYGNNAKAEMNNVEASAFAVVDTSSVNKIFIADKDGKQALLERTPGQRYWSLNGKYLARKDAVDLLLKTFKRVKVQSPVAQSKLETVNRMLAGRAKKVEIYQGEESPSKVWYIGTSDQSHTGTYMLLGDAGGNVADEPFVTHMEGFTGFLSTRFFTDEREWRYTGVFDYPGKSLGGIHVQHHESAMDYTMRVDSIGNLSFTGLKPQTQASIDTLDVKDHFNRFRKVHLETYNNHLSDRALDSILQVPAAFTLSAWNADSTMNSTIELLWKQATMDTYDDFGNLNPWDGARMYARFKGEVVLVQTFVFDPLLKSSF
jgi:hypothetical protein